MGNWDGGGVRRDGTQTKQFFIQYLKMYSCVELYAWLNIRARSADLQHTNLKTVLVITLAFNLN